MQKLSKSTKKTQVTTTSEPLRMSFDSYLYLKNLIAFEMQKLEKDFQTAINFIPNEGYKYGRKTGLDKAHEIFMTAYHKLSMMKEELAAAAAATYKDHPNPEMRKFWGVKE